MIKRNGTLIDDEDLTKKIAQTVLEGMSKEQKKHNKKDIMIRIAGAVSLGSHCNTWNFLCKS